MGISINVDSKAFRSLMKELKQTTKNLAPAFRDFGYYMRKETDKQFKSETDPEGNRWARLAPSTLLRKRTNTILRETGYMYKSMYFRTNNKRFIFGLRDPKYVFHHFGTSRMPDRVVVGITDERRAKLNRFVVLQIRRVKGLRSRRSRN